jgi:hypothetical protein
MRYINFLLGTWLGAAICIITIALAQTPPKPKTEPYYLNSEKFNWPTVETPSVIMNTAFDPDGKARGLKVDKDGRVIAHCE